MNNKKKLIVCPYCGAKFSSDVSLDFGHYEGTSGSFNRQGTYSESFEKTGKCIICKRKIDGEK